jgi:hypothetical protein
VDDGGYFGEGVVLVVDLVEEVGFVLVENDQQRLALDLVHLELVVPLQVLELVFVLHPKTVSLLLHDHYHVGREEHHYVALEN